MKNNPGRCFGPQELQSITCGNTVTYQLTTAVTDRQGQGTRTGTGNSGHYQAAGQDLLETIQEIHPKALRNTWVAVGSSRRSYMDK